MVARDPKAHRKRARARAQSSGASVVGTLIAVGVVVTVAAALILTLGARMQEKGERQGACLVSFSCGGGSGGGAASAGLGGGAPATSGGGFWNGAADVAKGFFVDGLWGTVTGLASAIAHPIDTVTGLANAIAHPIDTGTAIRNAIVRAWNENPQRVIGAGIFELATAPLAAAKGARVATVARAVDRAGDAANAVADAGRIESRACAGGTCRPGSGSCFARGTTVTTPDGDRSIETIAIGELVIARHPETGAIASRPVTQLFVTPDREVLDLGLEATPGRVEHFVVTPEHPFWLEGRGFIAVGALAPGDRVETASGSARVVSMASLPDRVTVYNFEVADDHTYFVGKTGAWVHNSCTGPIRAGDDVIVPRSDGSVSGGRVIADVGNGRSMVEVPGPNGEMGRKTVPTDSLTRRREVGDQVTIPRSDGSTSQGTVVLSHPDGRVTVTWQEGGRELSKTVPESQLRDAAASPAPPARKFGEPYVDGTRHGYYPSGIFSVWQGPRPVPSEGWKLHVSAETSRSYEVADRVLPVLREMGVTHKVMADPPAYGQMTGGQAGKFITIYPENAQQAAAIAQRIDGMLGDMPRTAPTIAGERPLGQSGTVFTRYGGFDKTTVTDPRTGREVRDQRGQIAPPWVPDPFGGM